MCIHSITFVVTVVMISNIYVHEREAVGVVR